MCMDCVNSAGKNYNDLALVSTVKTEWRKHEGPSLRRWNCAPSQFAFLIAAESSCFDICLDTLHEKSLKCLEWEAGRRRSGQE